MMLPPDQDVRWVHQVQGDFVGDLPPAASRALKKEQPVTATKSR